VDGQDFGVAAIARRQRLTPRYVHKLFEGEGLTFSAFVLCRRLSRAHRLLSDPRLGDRTIGSVAFDVGFGDVSYFNRTFRRRYDATPSEISLAADRDTSWHGSLSPPGCPIGRWSSATVGWRGP
jgi:AraC-like DNA-binding protein